MNVEFVIYGKNILHHFSSPNDQVTEVVQSYQKRNIFMVAEKRSKENNANQMFHHKALLLHFEHDIELVFFLVANDCFLAGV